MWIEEITLENIKCFEKQSIRLGTTKNCHKWITLLGENGTGKSTFLQALALMMAGPEGAIQLLKPQGWLKEDGLKPGKLTIKIHQGANDPGLFGGDKKERKAFTYTFYITGEKKISINNKAFTEPAIVEDPNNKIMSWLRQNALLPKGKGWFGAGYGAFRRLTRGNRILVPSLQQPLRYTNFYSQFREDESLEAFETWLVYLDYRISKSDNKDTLAVRQKKLGIDAINQLLPDGNSFDSIDSEGRIWFNTGNTKVSTVALSDGFRSIMALAGDLVWRLIDAFPESLNPLKEEGVVLIDELDIHLHPKWQREIASRLRETFPNLQFIMATHSPLVAAGAGSDAVTYRFVREDEKVVIKKIENISTWSVDRILKSDAFSLVSEFSPETQMHIDRYYKLIPKKNKTKKEETDLKQSSLFVEQALGSNFPKTSLELEMNEYIKKNLK